MARPTPAEILRAELEHRRRTLPTFLRPQLGEVIEKLDDWVLSVEARYTALNARLQGIDKMPSPATLNQLVGA